MADIEKRVIYPWFTRFEYVNKGVLRLMASFTILVWVATASIILYGMWVLTSDPHIDPKGVWQGCAIFFFSGLIVPIVVSCFVKFCLWIHDGFNEAS